MSVTKMKFVNIVGPKNEFDKCISQYVIDSGMHIENANSFLDNTPGLSSFSVDNPYSSLLKKIEAVFYHANIKPVYTISSQIEENLELFEKYADSIDQRLGQMYDKRVKMDSEIIDLERLKRQLELMSDMSVPLEKFFHLEFIKFRFGRLPIESYKKLREDLPDIEAFLVPVLIEIAFVWCIYFAPSDYSEKIDGIFSSLYFERIRISDKAQGTPIQAHGFISQELSELLDEKAKLVSEIDSFIKLEIENLTNIYSKIKHSFESYNIRKYAMQTEQAFYVAGWMPQDNVEGLVKLIDKDESSTYILEDPEDIKKVSPPTLLKNLPFVKPFETFINMYGLPGYKEIDPTLFLAFTYVLMFGIMFGDLGQGFVIALGGFLMYRLKGSQLGGVFTFAGLSSMIFGLMYGSVFGIEDVKGLPALWEKPMENINTTLFFGIALGMIFIITVIVMNIINGIRQKDTGKVLFSQNGLAGLILYLSVIFSVAYFILTKKNIMAGGIAFLLIAIPVVCIFLKEPLTHFLQKKKELIEGNKGEFFLEAFFELFEILLSFVANTISFVRVGAFALSHIGMMSVVFAFAAMSKGATSIVVIIIGNLFVIALEGLIVGIQVLRLEFYEMFGRFFSGDGKEFKPLVIDNKNI